MTDQILKCSKCPRRLPEPELESYDDGLVCGNCFEELVLEWDLI